MHGLPWAHVRYDLDRGGFVDVPGVCETEDDLRALCDPDRYVDLLADDQIVRIFTLSIGGQVDDVDDLQALAEAFGIDVDLRNPGARAADAKRLHMKYGYESTEFLLDRWRAFSDERGKKLMVVLFYSPDIVEKILTAQPRYDSQFVEYLDRNNVPHVDLAARHGRDYQAFGAGYNEYFDRYWVHAAGAAVFQHYSAAGNFFTAMSMAKDVANWLDPKPVTYRD